MRLAGGGRYDNLISAISEGETDLPAAGFAIGDVTFTNLLQELDHTRKRIDDALRAPTGAFIVIADETRRPEAIGLANTLRQSGMISRLLPPTGQSRAPISASGNRRRQIRCGDRSRMAAGASQTVGRTN